MILCRRPQAVPPPHCPPIYCRLASLVRVASQVTLKLPEIQPISYAAAPELFLPTSVVGLVDPPIETTRDEIRAAGGGNRAAEL